MDQQWVDWLAHIRVSSSIGRKKKDSLVLRNCILCHSMTALCHMTLLMVSFALKDYEMYNAGDVNIGIFSLNHSNEVVKKIFHTLLCIALHHISCSELYSNIEMWY